VALFWPPGGDRRYTEVFGFTLEEIFEEGARSLESKLRSAGMPIDTLPGPQLMPIDLPLRDRAERGLALVRTGVMGGGEVPVQTDADAQAILFDMVRRAVAPDAPAMTIEWDFTDGVPPWHLRVDGDAAAAPGPAPHADVTLRCSYTDWVDLVGGRPTPAALALRGRLRPRGSLRALARLLRVFPK
jgi:hypothetical protein